MALVKKESNPQRTLILVSIMIVVVIVALYYFILQPAMDKGGSGTTAPEVTDQRNRDLRALDERLAPDLEKILTDPRFQDLKQYGDTRIEVAPQGKINPFQPF